VEVGKSITLYGSLWPCDRKIVLRDVGHLRLLKGAWQLASVIFSQAGDQP